MPRPNHDIPNLILGAIKEHADGRGFDSDEQGHIELLTFASVILGQLPEDRLDPDLRDNPDIRALLEIDVDLDVLYDSDNGD